MPPISALPNANISASQECISPAPLSINSTTVNITRTLSSTICQQGVVEERFAFIVSYTSPKTSFTREVSETTLEGNIVYAMVTSASVLQPEMSFNYNTRLYKNNLPTSDKGSITKYNMTFQYGLTSTNSV